MSGGRGAAGGVDRGRWQAAAGSSRRLGRLIRRCTGPAADRQGSGVAAAQRGSRRQQQGRTRGAAAVHSPSRALAARAATPRRWVAVNEVRLLASLHHPNVVQYKQCFVQGPCLYVVMEVVPNGELSAVIQ